MDPERLTLLSSPQAAKAGLAYEILYAVGLEEVCRLAGDGWTDFNLHDPGVTTLELLCYAVSDLIHRARFPIEDLLTGPAGEELADDSPLVPPRRALPNRPLTQLDYRKLLIDVPGVRNAWLRPQPFPLAASPREGRLFRLEDAPPGARRIEIRGLHRVLLAFDDGVEDDQKEAIEREVERRLHAHRNLCEDFTAIDRVARQEMIVCAEIEIRPDADTADVEAAILHAVQTLIAPRPPFRTAPEMLARPRADGSARELADVFDGPVLDGGFLDDDELLACELRAEIALSDVHSAVMDVDGVLAVRDLLVHPRGLSEPLANKWRVPIDPEALPTLHRADSRLVFYKGSLPLRAERDAVEQRYAELATEAQRGGAAGGGDPIPAGRHRRPGRYYSFQNHYPALYNLADGGTAGLPAERRALALQLKAYLTFFDQPMANYLAQLDNVRHLFSLDPAQRRSYFTQIVDSFADSDQIYADDAADRIADLAETPKRANARRNRFLDHLIARYAERFHDYAAITASLGDGTAGDLIEVKCRFLRDCAESGAARAQALDLAAAAGGDVWDSANVSGLERRLARLLGIADDRRRNLSTVGDAAIGAEGMHVVENILLRPRDAAEPTLRVCVDPDCTGCADCDPYSRRLHFVLPAYAGRFAAMEFRRFVEETIRRETPAHILPKVCWLSLDRMASFEAAWKAWLETLSGDVAAEERAARLTALFDALYEGKNVYPAEALGGGEGAEEKGAFVLGRSALGSQKPPSEGDGD